MSEYINKADVVNMLIELENEFQQHKTFYGFNDDVYKKLCETEVAIGKMKPMNEGCQKCESHASRNGCGTITIDGKTYNVIVDHAEASFINFRGEGLYKHSFHAVEVI